GDRNWRVRTTGVRSSRNKLPQWPSLVVSSASAESSILTARNRSRRVTSSRRRHRMAFDQDLAASVRTALAGASAIPKSKCSAGIGFMLNGNLVASVSKRGLLVRVGKDHRGNALAQQGARPLVMRGRTMERYIYVDPSALNNQAVQKWLQLAVAFVQTLPPRPDRGRSPQ